MDTGLNINTKNEVFVSNATLLRIYAVALVIFLSFFLLKKYLQ